MGADGGINWVLVTGDKDEFYSLVRPLGLLWQTNKCYDEYHYDYLDENPMPKPSKGFYEVSTYGSFNLVQGMDDLQALIDELESYKDRDIADYDAWHGSDPLQLTWKEIFEDYLTSYARDAWHYGWESSCVRLIKEQLDWTYDRSSGEIKQYDDAIYHITLGEWLERIKRVIDLKSFGSTETWT